MHLLLKVQHIEEAISEWWDRVAHNIETDKQIALDDLKKAIVDRAVFTKAEEFIHDSTKE